MNTLKVETVKFASIKGVDKNGAVFYWNDGVYRAIPAEKEQVYRTLLENNNFSKLYDLGLVETEIADIKLEGYPLVLKHKKISTVSYVTEWSGNMLKDAALLTLNINEALREFGMELQDAHPWNILFEGGRPVFIDFGSIIPLRATNQWKSAQEFIGMFYYPLRLMSFDLPRQARSLMLNWVTLRGKQITKFELLKILLKKRKFSPFFKTIIGSAPSTKQDRVNIIEALRQIISSIEIPLSKSSWSDYCDEEVDLTTIEDWMVKRRTAYEVILRCKPKTVLDIGSNTGWFSKLAAQHGAVVTAFDLDETSINKLYLNIKNTGIPILPLSMNFTKPTPAYGIGLRCQPAIERYKAELVFGLAIMHHLVFKQKIGFEESINKFKAFTEKWLLVEFIPKEDKYVSQWYNETYSWYTLDNFVLELKQHFRYVEVLPSNPDPRVIIFCEV